MKKNYNSCQIPRHGIGYIRQTLLSIPILFFSLMSAAQPPAVLPFTENFDNMTAVGIGIFPISWVDENPGVWESTNAIPSTTTSGPLSGPNNIRVKHTSNATIWTPEFNLVAGETYSFSFNFAGDTHNSWDGAVYVNGSQSFAGATMLGAKFVENGDPTSFTYEEVEYCFTPATTGTYAFGVKVIENTNNGYMSFDDFELKIASNSAGTDGALSVCKTAAPVDLSTVITTSATNGIWKNTTYQSSISGTMFDLSNVPIGVHEILFITNGCIADTAVATITIDPPSFAGNDGTLTVCRNQQFNLFAGLSGSTYIGGVWTDAAEVVIPNGINTIHIPGIYIFRYIVANGSCPSDTSYVTVTVLGHFPCGVGVEDIPFEGFNIYPNPTSDIIFITNTGSTEVFNYEVLAMNGRVILKADDPINGSTSIELNLGKVESGIYLIRVFNEKAEKTFRVVKN